MTERPHESQKTHLTVALAQGTSAAKWARTNGVPKATAYRWSQEPAVRAQIESIRRRAIDRAVGRMARRMTWATDGIAKLACWQRAESTWDLSMLALRAGTNPQALITTTPRRHAVLKRILAEPTTVQTTDTTYANQAHLPREFLTQIAALYENTRLGRQEIYAEFLDTTEGVWFASFDPARHIYLEAEYDPAWFVRCAIDAGTSRHTAAVFFQVRTDPLTKRPRSESCKPQSDNAWRNATTANGRLSATDTCRTDPNLACVVDAWPTSPVAIKAGIVAMARAATT
jgi:hypothetical protein